MSNSITVCIPTCFENPNFLMELLKTISYQKKLPYETLIIVNSKKFTDNLILKSIKEFGYGIPDNINHKFIIADKIGLSRARNIAIDNCKTDVLIFGDDDDLWHHEKISSIDKEITKNGTSLIRHGFDLLVNEKQQPAKIKHRINPYFFLIGVSNFLGGGSSISGSTCIFKTLKFNESLLSCEDWDFWIRAYLSKVKIISIPKVLVTYRVHGGRMTKNNFRMLKYEFIVRFKYILDLFKISIGFLIGLLIATFKSLIICFKKFF